MGQFPSLPLFQINRCHAQNCHQDFIITTLITVLRTYSLQSFYREMYMSMFPRGNQLFWDKILLFWRVSHSAWDCLHPFPGTAPDPPRNPNSKFPSINIIINVFLLYITEAYIVRNILIFFSRNSSPSGLYIHFYHTRPGW